MPEYFHIEGQGTKKVLRGEILVSGAKNAALKAFPASLLFTDGLTVTNVPEIEDVRTTASLASLFGIPIERRLEGAYSLGPRKGKGTKLDRELSKKIRASIMMTGPILARYGAVTFYFPGGCLIGKRPIDQYLRSFTAMGAKVKETEIDGTIEITVTAPKRGLKGATLFLRMPSVGVTETLMMAAVLSRGVTTIKNAAMEPEIIALADYLHLCGASIEGAGTPTIKIEGGELLQSKGRPYITIPDRIEAGSFVILAALIGKDVTIGNCEPAHLDALLHELKECGVRFEVGKDFVRVRESKKTYTLGGRSLALKTHEYPGFPTDLQAPMLAFLTQVEGDSSVFETIFESRLEYVADINKMGGSIVPVAQNQVVIHGPTPLVGREMKAMDLRSGMAFLILGLMSKGESRVENAYNIDRGYAHIEDRLRAIGARIERVYEKD